MSPRNIFITTVRIGLALAWAMYIALATCLVAVYVMQYTKVTTGAVGQAAMSADALVYVVGGYTVLRALSEALLHVVVLWNDDK